MNHHHAADHGRGHAHDRAHDHAQGDHHGHAHDPSAVAIPGLSLLRLSAFQRLSGAAGLSALIWAGVWWAMK